MSEPIKPEVSVITEDYEVKAGGDFYQTELKFFPLDVTIRLSIHKDSKDNALILEMLKRSFKIANLDLSDPDKPHITLEEVGPRSGITRSR